MTSELFIEYGTYLFVFFFIFLFIFEKVRFSKDLKEVLLSVLSLVLALWYSSYINHFVVLSTIKVKLDLFVTTPRLFKVILAVLAVDFYLYWLHRGMHKFKALWRAHRWHHNLPEFNQLASFRTSFIHNFLYYFGIISIPLCIFDINASDLVIGLIFSSLVNLWQHADIGLGRLEVINYFFITPDFHRVHHYELDKSYNFSNILTIWDSIFRTRLCPKSIERRTLTKDYKINEVPRLLIGL